MHTCTTTGSGKVTGKCGNMHYIYYMTAVEVVKCFSVHTCMYTQTQTT